MSRRKWLWTTLTLGAALTVTPALAQKKYDPGASDTEIKVGNMNPYSGPASAYGLIGKTIDFGSLKQQEKPKPAPVATTGAQPQ